MGDKAADLGEQVGLSASGGALDQGMQGVRHFVARCDAEQKDPVVSLARNACFANQVIESIDQVGLAQEGLALVIVLYFDFGFGAFFAFGIEFIFTVSFQFVGELVQIDLDQVCSQSKFFPCFPGNLFHLFIFEQIRFAPMSQLIVMVFESSGLPACCRVPFAMPPRIWYWACAGGVGDFVGILGVDLVIRSSC
jgi:hypothetical protein